MNLYRLLQKRLDAGRPVRVGLIGAGKFGSMFLSQVPTTPGLEVAVIADLSPDRARAACRNVGWDDARIAATRFTDDSAALLADPAVEVVVEATGHAPAGLRHARRAIAEGKHIVMVNVEADVLAGPLLARQVWWLGTAVSTAAALWLFLRNDSIVAKVVAVALLALPHLIGAPEPVAFESKAPAELAAHFAAASLTIQAALWILSGLAAGALWMRFQKRAPI